MNWIEKMFPELAGQTWQVVVICLSVAVFVFLLLAAAEWKIFVKMGEKGWKALIPVYSAYLLLKKCSTTKILWQIILSMIVSGVIDLLYYMKWVEQDTWQFYCASVAQLAASIWMIVLYVKMYGGVSRSFGHRGGFTVGLFFLPFIFELILGFGSSNYIGNATQAKQDGKVA